MSVSARSAPWGAWALAALPALPLVGVLFTAIHEALRMDAWLLLAQAPHVGQSLVLTLWTGLAATFLSWVFAAWMLASLHPGPRWGWLTRRLSAMLAVPHAAFTIGLVFLVAPSGWLLRWASPWLTGFDAPPAWVTTQDPWGMGLIVALVGKEVPFLLWCAAAQLARGDVAERLPRELTVVHSLGHGPFAAWWLVVWPQLWPRMLGPTLAVLAYSLTVVDMAILIGPTNPPTLAVQAWQWLADGDTATNAQGAAAAWLLAAVVAGAVGLVWIGRQWVARIALGGLGNGRRRARGPWLIAPRVGDGLAGVWLLLYVAVVALLGVSSVAGVWPFPQLWPSAWSTDGWRSVWASVNAVSGTVWLALTASASALLWSVAWLEWGSGACSQRWDARLRQLVALPLLIPSVLWALGLHRLSLHLGLDGTGDWGGAGLWLAHTLAALPYVLIALAPAYQAFEPRYAHICASLGHGRWYFLWRVKWPLLRAALAASFAVGVAVSVAQYLPTLFVGAGRFDTVTTQAIAVASGGQRSVAAAYAWLQGLIPVLGFAFAAWVGRPRRFRGV